MAKPTMIDEEDGVKRIFWSCPVRFVPSSVWSFIAYNNFYHKHPSAPFPKYEDISPRYRLAEIAYDRAMIEVLQEA